MEFRKLLNFLVLSKKRPFRYYEHEVRCGWKVPTVDAAVILLQRHGYKLYAVQEGDEPVNAIQITVGARRSPAYRRMIKSFQTNRKKKRKSMTDRMLEVNKSLAKLFEETD